MKDVLKETPPIVKWWLVLGAVLVFFQIFIGGITRLTGSGLSITKWEIVIGTFPPTTDAAWQIEFEKYQATPQYQKINRGMSLDDFKFIYFWEYFHRLWARMMGLVFLLPFLYFLGRNHLSKSLLKRLSFVVFFAMLAAIFGWIMVASGLIERPWVNAYKLSIHLTLGFSVLAFLLWAVFHEWESNRRYFDGNSVSVKKLANWCFGIGIVQFILGGLMSGMKAGLIYPTWPQIGNEYFPIVLLDSNSWKISNLENYDTHIFAPALIQFFHRNTGYLLFVLSILLAFKLIKSSISEFKFLGILLGVVMFLQVILGIFTLINCIGTIPVFWGILHQSGGVILLSVLLYVLFKFRLN